MCKRGAPGESRLLVYKMSESEREKKKIASHPVCLSLDVVTRTAPASSPEASHTHTHGLVLLDRRIYTWKKKQEFLEIAVWQSVSLKACERKKERKKKTWEKHSIYLHTINEEHMNPHTRVGIVICLVLNSAIAALSIDARACLCLLSTLFGSQCMRFPRGGGESCSSRRPNLRCLLPIVELGLSPVIATKPVVAVSAVSTLSTWGNFQIFLLNCCCLLSLIACGPEQLPSPPVLLLAGWLAVGSSRKSWNPGPCGMWLWGPGCSRKQ